MDHYGTITHTHVHNPLIASLPGFGREKNRVHVNSRLPVILFGSPVALGRENRAVRLWILGVGPGGYMRLNHWYELGDGDRDMDADT